MGKKNAMSSAGDDPEVENMAKGEANRLQSYLDRGRKFETYSRNELQDQFIVAYRRWSRDVTDKDLSQLTSDLSVEFNLRKEDPPYAVVEEEVDAITKSIAAMASTLDKDRLTEINDQMVEEYDDAKRRQT